MTVNACPNAKVLERPFLFTGKERDQESGNDYFGARYYASMVGRFMTPDWSVKVEPVPYANLTDPQTLNLYAYVRNNPLALEDSDGHGFQWCSESGLELCQNTAGAPPEPQHIPPQALDKARSIGGAVKEGYGTATELTGEFKEAKKWHDIMQKAFDNAVKPSSSGLEAENLYYYAVYQYAQQEAIYHGTKAGLSMVDVENGMFTPPASWFIKITNELVTSGIRAQAQSNAEMMRQKMNEAHEIFVQRLIAVYGSQ